MGARLLWAVLAVLVAFWLLGAVLDAIGALVRLAVVLLVVAGLTWLAFGARSRR